MREELRGELADPSPAKILLIGEAAKSALITKAVGEWILSQATLVRDGGDLLPAVMQHAQLQTNLTRILGALGLQGMKEEPPTLQDYVRRKYGRRQG